MFGVPALRALLWNTVKGRGPCALLIEAEMWLEKIVRLGEQTRFSGTTLALGIPLGEIGASKETHMSWPSQVF